MLTSPNPNTKCRPLPAGRRSVVCSCACLRRLNEPLIARQAEQPTPSCGCSIELRRAVRPLPPASDLRSAPEGLVGANCVLPRNEWRCRRTGSAPNAVTAYKRCSMNVGGDNNGDSPWKDRYILSMLRWSCRGIQHTDRPDDWALARHASFKCHTTSEWRCHNEVTACGKFHMASAAAICSACVRKNSWMTSCLHHRKRRMTGEQRRAQRCNSWRYWSCDASWYQHGLVCLLQYR